MSDTIINDPIHGTIYISPLCVRILNTPQMQRLRNIKQLGLCSYVYPGACHKRFEHSIGVCHLAGVFARHLQIKLKEDMDRFEKEENIKQLDELDQIKMTKNDILCIEIAGLCHDIGHGPFSHLFDQMFYKEETIIKDGNISRDWTHEEASEQMFQHMLNQNESLKKEMMKTFQVETHDELQNIIDFIKDLITGKVRNKPDYMFQIVANKTYEIDVDKMDYLARDCHGLGMKSDFDRQRYMLNSRVMMAGEGTERRSAICIRDKAIHDLYELFNTRDKLFRRAYYHKVSKGIEYMITEALVAVNDVYVIDTDKGYTRKISEAWNDMFAYEKLTDGIIDYILLAKDTDDRRLKLAKALLRRIQNRNLYTCIYESTPSAESIKDTNDIKKKIEEMKIPSEDFLIKTYTFSFSKRTDNPIKNVYFFKKNTYETFKKDNPAEVSHLLPRDNFKEEIFRVYSKYSKEQKEERAKLAEAIKKMVKSSKTKISQS